MSPLIGRTRSAEQACGESRISDGGRLRWPPADEAAKAGGKGAAGRGVELGWTEVKGNAVRPRPGPVRSDEWVPSPDRATQTQSLRDRVAPNKQIGRAHV